MRRADIETNQLPVGQDKCWAYIKIPFELATGELPDNIWNRRKGWVIPNRLIPLLTSAALSWGFSVKCNEGVTVLIPGGESSTWVTLIGQLAALAQALSLGANLVVNGSSIRAPFLHDWAERFWKEGKHGLTGSEVAALFSNILTLGIAALPALIFLRPLIGGSTPAWLALIAGFGRWCQMNHGLQNIGNSYLEMLAFVLSKESPAAKVKWTILSLVCLGLVGGIGYMNANFVGPVAPAINGSSTAVPYTAYPMTTESPDAELLGWVSWLCHEIGSASSGMLEFLRFLVASTYAASFTPIMFKGVVVISHVLRRYPWFSTLLLTACVATGGSNFVDFLATAGALDIGKDLLPAIYQICVTAIINAKSMATLLVSVFLVFQTLSFNAALLGGPVLEMKTALILMGLLRLH